MDEELTPYDLTNERALLGACLLDRDAITVIRDTVSIDDFYLEKHAAVYRAMINLVERRVPPDISTVAGELKAAGSLDMVGGLSFLGELAQETMTAVHVEHYAQRVIETSTQRRIIQLGAEMQIRAKRGGDTSALFTELQQMMDITKQASTPKANWEEAVVPARLLYAHKFEDQPCIIDQVLPQGSFLLVGKPKTKKSWFALNYAWAVSSGGKALGKYQAMHGDALYIDLEMGARRIHKRMHVVSPDLAPPKGFSFATRWPRVGGGFETWFRDYMKSHPYTRLVIVDTMVAIRPTRQRYADPYEADKSFTQSLTDLCHDYPIAMLIIHHSRKADGSDVTDDGSGTNGLTGGVDNYASLRLTRGEKGKKAELLFAGRDIEMADDLYLEWDARLAQWNAVEGGADTPAALTPERRDVLGLLSERPGLKPKEIALLLKRDEPGTRRLLGMMQKDDLVTNAQGGYWYVADDSPDE